MADLEVRVGGRFQKLDCLYGDIEFSTVWPGGMDSVSWTPSTQSPRRFTGGEIVEVYFGPVCVGSGNLVEPDASQDQLTAVGAWNLGAYFAALDGSGDATTVPDDAVDRAIGDGLTWVRAASLHSATTATDISQGPVMINTLLDTWTANNGLQWGVNPQRRVYAIPPPIAPIYQTLPVAGGLGYALDNYASTLIGRFLDSADSTYKSTDPVTDGTAEALHGHREALVDLSGRGAITKAHAETILGHLLDLGRATPQWTSSLDLSYGDVLNMGGARVALETIAAGALIRVQGGYELAQRLNGQMYLDVPIGRTTLSGGVLTVQPAQVVVTDLDDAITAALSKRK